MRRYKHSKKRIDEYIDRKEKKRQPSIRMQRWLQKANKELEKELVIQREAKKIFDYLFRCIE